MASSPVPSGGGSYLVSSTPKPSSIAAQLSTSMRKDLQLSSNSFSATQPPFQRRTAGGGGGGVLNANTHPTTTRRFSSASVVGARVARQVADSDLQQHSNISGSSVTAITNSASSNGGSGSVGGISVGGGNGGTASDSDSGKVRTLKSTFFGWLNKI